MLKRVRLDIVAGVLVLVAAAAAPAAAQTSTPGALENLGVFLGLDGSKQPQDLGINANMGIRWAANLGLPINDALNLGAQIGIGQNFSDAAVHVLEQVEGTSSRRQTFLTAGVFQRLARLNWGLAYDASLQTYYDDFSFGQVRGQLGVAVRESDELGVRVAKSAKGDSGTMGGTPVQLDPISQVTGYHRHTWATSAQTTVFAGIARGHHNVVWVFPDNSRDENVFVYGAELSLPLSERFAVSGSANLVTPASTGTVDAYLGITFYPGRSGMRAATNRFAPLIQVANNPEMAINLHR